MTTPPLAIAHHDTDRWYRFTMIRKSGESYAVVRGQGVLSWFVDEWLGSAGEGDELRIRRCDERGEHRHEDIET